jgi:hypothetical protein
MIDSILKKWESRLNSPVSNVKAALCEFFDDPHWNKDYILPNGKPIAEALNANSTLTELIDAFGTLKDLEKEYEVRKRDSPDWSSGLLTLMDELTSYLQTKDIYFCPGIAVDGIQLRSFQDLTAGKNYELSKYDFNLCDYLGIKFRPELIYDLAKGAALATFIPKLRAEIEGREYKETSLLEQSDRVKLKWTGKKSQMYYLLRYLKRIEIIGNSYDELGIFLHQSVIPFGEAELSTINGQLSKKITIPKDKRIEPDLMNGEE